MRLYTTGSQWAGTQADAKKLGKFVQVDVPTDKQGLLDWLNKMHWHTTEAVAPIQEPSAPIRQPSAPKVSNDDYNSVRTYLETCDAQELNRCLTIICSRLHDFLD